MIDKFVEELRSWIGTNYKHQGRLKKSGRDNGGCDCLGLVVGAACRVGILSKLGEKLDVFDKRNYSTQPDGYNLVEELSKHLIRVDIKDMSHGDLLLFEFNKTPQHLGVLLTDTTTYKASVIHCHSSIGRVVEHRLSNAWFSKIKFVFRCVF